MLSARYDAVVVGAGPGGSTAALVLARAGARVALVDKATFARDKACGDLIGPRGIALLTELGLDPGPGRRVGEMVVVGPTGRRVMLPARAGLHLSRLRHRGAPTPIRFMAAGRRRRRPEPTPSPDACVRSPMPKADGPRSSSPTVATSRPMSSSEPTERPAS